MGEGYGHPAWGVQEEMKLTRTDSLNKKGFDVYVVTMW